MEEIWVDIKWYEGLYQVSSIGRVKSMSYRNQHIVQSRELVLKPTRYFYYSCIDLRKDGIRKLRRIHRLVAEAFIPNPNNFPNVLHIDETVTEAWFASNNVENLRWGTQAENNADIYLKGRDNNPMKRGVFICKKWAESHNAKVVLQYSIEGEFIKQWWCANDVATFYKVSRHSVYSALLGHTKTCRGFIWRYL